MAFKDFPHQQYYRDLATDTVTPIGYFNLAVGIDLEQIVLTLYQQGTIASPYNMRLHLYGNPNSTVPLFTSDWAEVSATTLLNDDDGTAYTQNWTGIFPLDYDGVPLNPDTNYYMSVETSGYTRVLDTFYVGINLDWYSEVNNQIDGPDLAGARIRILGKL